MLFERQFFSEFLYNNVLKIVLFLLLQRPLTFDIDLCTEVDLNDQRKTLTLVVVRIMGYFNYFHWAQLYFTSYRKSFIEYSARGR